MNLPTNVRATQDLLPRRYQEEVFCRAQAENVIAALDTGSGKTFISTLLVKWVASKETSHTKAIIFLVPKVTLVEQQGDFIAKHTPLRVIKLHGSMDIDLADRVGWKKKFETFHVLVMTAQIFLNLLTHSHWSIDKVSLMIFDECHHARKNHPYNGIMREYFQVPTQQRPKIFGMTASPIWNPKDAVGSLADLEKNMDAKVVGVRAHVSELADHSPKPLEIIAEYPPPPGEYDYPYPSLSKVLSIFGHWSELGVPWTNIEMRYFVTLSNLGPYCAELYLYTDMQHHVIQLINESLPVVQEIDMMDMDAGEISFLSSKQCHPDLLEAKAILSDYQAFFVDESSSGSLPITIPLKWCSPKVKVLADILLTHHSPTFQGIVFVEQRQVASCLAKVLPCIPELDGLIRCAELVGQGVNSEGISRGIGSRGQRDAVKLFRNGRINLLIATSVAEEGLDFPACDIVVRFDPLQHMVGYVQSRGRARNRASKFVIMIQKDDTAHLARYQAFLSGEPELKRAYQMRQDDTPADDDEDEAEEVDPVDLAERERYVVASSGAILTYDSSINLLNYLCSLIPCDSFTPIHTPKYSGDFEATLHLPTSLPLSPENLVYIGPLKRSKKEAKRAVAFLAVKRLHLLDVFDDYLLPVSSTKGKGNEDADGRSIIDVSRVPVMMDVLVCDPWTTEQKLWIHPVRVDGRRLAGLVTGTVLPPSTLKCGSSAVQIDAGELIKFGKCEADEREMMQEFTTMGIWYRITGRPVTLPLSLFLVPITPENQPDMETIARFAASPHGSYDWSGVCEDDYDRLTIINENEFGRTLLLRRIRYDLSPMSVPLPGSRESQFPTYYDYFVKKWTRKRRVAHVPTTGPLVEALILPRYQSGKYTLIPQNDDFQAVHSAPNGILVPQGCCRRLNISEDVLRAFEILPPLCHRITDMYRVQQACFELGLPPIMPDLLAEAFTLPSSNAGYSNQRMETLGDAVLELCTSVHVFNKYPHRHEGQLSALRQNAISNRCLLARAKEINLEQFLTSEIQSVSSWRYSASESDDISPELHPRRYTSRVFPRRSLQDCMEATLGAAFLTGGIPMALRAGDALGLSFGGPLPWSLRYSQNKESSPVSPLLEGLQDKLGYTFHQSNLLVAAVTHPSFAASSGGTSYQRLEFLGDALLDLVVIKYLFDKFPDATSEQLAFPRTRAICAPALASLAVRRLGLHKIMLFNSVDLGIAMTQYIPLLEAISGEDIVKRGWRYDPPKAISDVFESVMGAVFVDSGHNYERAAAVVEYVMEDVLTALSPSLQKDPTSELTEWMSGSGCRKVVFMKTKSRPEAVQPDGIAVLVHDVTVAGPIISASLSVAKGLASEKALCVLKDLGSEKCLSRLCDCRNVMDVDTGTTDDQTVLADAARSTDHHVELVEIEGDPGEHRDIPEIPEPQPEEIGGDREEEGEVAGILMQNVDETLGS